MSTPDTIRKDGASKSTNGVCEVMKKLSTADNKDGNDASVSVCASCGKEGNSDDMNTCNKCKLVKYCNAVCKKKHRSKHKKACERRVAELLDEKLFGQSPPKEDCPICFLRLPLLLSGRSYQSCCGKVICSGCVHAPVYDNQGNVITDEKCPFCRTTNAFSDEEGIERLNKRMEADDPIAIYNLGIDYRDGTGGYPQNYTKALELWHRAAELGYAAAYSSIGYAYGCGEGVELDMKKAKYYYEQAAIRGDSRARHNLGFIEGHAGKMDRALKLLMIAVKGGNNDSLNTIQTIYSKGYATKEDYTKALQSYQEYLGEIKSAQRDKAAGVREDLRYY